MVVETSRTTTTMTTTTRRSFPQCSPVAIFGFGLIIAQLMIFNIGISFFHNSDNDPTNSNVISMQLGRPSGGVAGGRTTTKSKMLLKQQQQQRPLLSDPNADGTFNGYPIYLRNKTKEDSISLIHCVGENYQEGESWKQRSCRFSFICFDMIRHDYVVYQNPDELQLYDHLLKRPFLDVSQSYMKRNMNHSNTVSLGGINLKWTKNGYSRLEWFPKIIPPNEIPTTGITYYELPSNVIMVPFHSLNGANPGHLIWDDFLPIYTLLTMFQLDELKEDDELEEDSSASPALLMMRYVLKDGDRGLWASCDWKEEKRIGCEYMHNKFLPLMMGFNPNHNLTTTETFNFQLNNKQSITTTTTSTTNNKNKPQSSSHLVCAKHGVAGMGPLTDHGTMKSHGWEQADYETTHNHGRGGMLYSFRNYMLNNLGMTTPDMMYYQHKPPFRIVFSEKSSNIPSRVIDFTSQIDLLRKSFNSKFVSVESYIFKDLSLEEQVRIASQTSIFITGCGGGAVTATFLPKGGSVFLYYVENGGVKDNRETGTPARLDWDLFNNLAYLKVHWLPKGTMHTETDLRALSYLVQHEIDGLMRERHGYNFFNE